MQETVWWYFCKLKYIRCDLHRKMYVLKDWLKSTHTGNFIDTALIDFVSVLVAIVFISFINFLIDVLFVIQWINC